MTRLAAALAACLLAGGSALAQSRPDTLSMTCAQVEETVARAGGIVLGTGEFVYDRYVLDARFCLRGQITKRMNVRTRDARYCPVQICIEPGNFFWD